MQSDKGLVKAVVERDQGTGVGFVQDLEDRRRAVITGAYIYPTFLEKRPFIGLDRGSVRERLGTSRSGDQDTPVWR